MLLGDLNVDGCKIRYCVDGAGRDTVVLVHGAGAHRQWWHLVVPPLAASYRVVTFDLSGHGDSGWRTAYGPRIYGREIHAVASALGRGRVYLVGHSMGGRCAAVAAGLHPDAYAGLILLDSTFPSAPRLERPHPAALTVYPDEASARTNFKLMPRQPHPAPDVLGPVMAYSLRPTGDGGWTWKFDPASLGRFDDAYVEARLGDVRCPLTYAYGAKSVLPGQATAERIRAKHPGAAIIRIEDGYHHLPLDSPSACVEVIRSAIDSRSSGSPPIQSHAGRPVEGSPPGGEGRREESPH
jgi:Predicted hydrolases or acyltransferases (alpha/beta hydrolase superfamily)